MVKLSVKKKYSSEATASVTRPKTAIPALRALLVRAARRVRIPTMPATNAYTAAPNASSSANDPTMSTDPPAESALVRQTGSVHGLAGLSGRRRAGRAGLILRSALGLNLLGLEAA